MTKILSHTVNCTQFIHYCSSLSIFVVVRCCRSLLSIVVVVGSLLLVTVDRCCRSFVVAHVDRCCCLLLVAHSLLLVIVFCSLLLVLVVRSFLSFVRSCHSFVLVVCSFMSFNRCCLLLSIVSRLFVVARCSTSMVAFNVVICFCHSLFRIFVIVRYCWWQVSEFLLLNIF